MAEISVPIGVKWVVSPVISLVINKTTTYIENKFFKKAGIEDDMKKMKTTLTEILFVMGTVEKRTIENLNQAKLVRGIEESVYDAEDIIDEFEYYLLEEKSKKEAQLRKNTVSRVAYYSFHAINRFIGGNKQFNKKVNEVCKSLNRAKVSAQTLLDLEYENERITDDSPISDKIFGREKEWGSHTNLPKRQELEPIAKTNVNKLEGSAPAIRAVGEQSRRNSDTEAWESVLNILDPLDTSHIMKILYFSYDHLPRHLQDCFSFCSLFPKDSILKPDQLVRMWIAAGFVSPQGGKSLDEVGRHYFNELLCRVFFQRIEQSHEVCYVLHDLMHDLANYVSKGHVHVLDELSSIQGTDSIKHLSVYSGAIDRLQDFNGLDKLRTLIVLNGAVNPSRNSEEIFKKLKSIRVLDIRCPSLRLTNDIGQCKHLRYLSIPNSDDPLPNSISKLHHLQVLLSI